jgi:biotin carboxyl carrier protein
VAAVSLQITLGDGEAHDVRLARSGEDATVWIDGNAYPARVRSDGAATVLTLDGRRETIWLVSARDRVFVHAFGRSWTLEVSDPVERSLRAGSDSDATTAPMPGVLVSLSVAAGDDVAAGQELAVIESMKMHSRITAWRDGRVERVMVGIGDSFAAGDPLIALEPLEPLEAPEAPEGAAPAEEDPR